MNQEINNNSFFQKWRFLKVTCLHKNYNRKNALRSNGLSQAGRSRGQHNIAAQLQRAFSLSEKKIDKL